MAVACDAGPVLGICSDLERRKAAFIPRRGQPRGSECGAVNIELALLPAASLGFEDYCIGGDVCVD